MMEVKMVSDVMTVVLVFEGDMLSSGHAPRCGRS